MEDTIDMVLVNVSGRKYEISRRSLQERKIPLLSGLKEDHIFIERHPQSFEMILHYIHTGGLHIPSGMCFELFQSEMEFWGIPLALLDSCCSSKHVQFLEEQLVRKQLMFTDDAVAPEGDGCYPKWRRLVWNFVEYPSSSKAAKIFSWASILMVALSILVLFAYTDPAFKYELSKNKVSAIFGGDTNKDNNNGGFSSNNFTDSSNPERILIVYTPIRIMDIACMVFFTAELMLRLVTCPIKQAFFKSLLNIIDIISLLSMYVILIVELSFPKENYTLNFRMKLTQLETLRIFRIFRFTRNFVAMRALCYSFKKSAFELILLLMFVLFGSTFFAGIIFVVEPRDNFPTLPESLWWSVITMTTVGYGDIVPTTFLGKLVGCICAISGIALLAATVPIFTNNFQMYYKVAQDLNVCHKVGIDKSTKGKARVEVWNQEMNVNGC